VRARPGRGRSPKDGTLQKTAALRKSQATTKVIGHKSTPLRWLLRRCCNSHHASRAARPCVQAVARASGLVQDTVGRLIARLVGIYPETAHNDPQSWPLCSQLTPHLLARREAGLDAVSEISDWPKLLDRAIGYFYGRAAYSQVAPLLHDALTIREKALGPEHPDTASSHNDLALLLKAQGDLAAVRPLLERALAIREKTLGPEHPDTASSDWLLPRLQTKSKLSLQPR